jgi:ERCC4-type nuclease
LRKFKSAKRVQKASLKELQEIVGDSRAKTIYQYFKKDE